MPGLVVSGVGQMWKLAAELPRPAHETLDALNSLGHCALRFDSVAICSGLGSLHRPIQRFR